jgi:hypothetical protein
MPALARVCNKSPVLKVDCSCENMFPLNVMNIEPVVENLEVFVPESSKGLS